MNRGFLLIPLWFRTWAPQGQTPIHRHRQGKRDKISVISGISVSPKRHELGLYYLLFLDNIGQEEVCLFYASWLRHLRAPCNRSAGQLLHPQGETAPASLGSTPRVSPSSIFLLTPRNSNPDEGVWSLSKRELANSCPEDVDELMEDILRSIDGIRASPEKLRGCITQSEYLMFLPLAYCILYAEINSGPCQRSDWGGGQAVPCRRVPSCLV